MRVRREVARPVEGAEEEPEDDLSEAVALVARERLHLVESDSLDVLADEHALAGQARDDIRHEDEGMAAPGTREAPVRLRFELVVELLREALANLGSHRL